MSQAPKARTSIPVSWLLGAVALLPAVVVAAVVLLEGSKLSVSHAKPVSVTYPAISAHATLATQVSHQVANLKLAVAGLAKANHELAGRESLGSGARGDALNLGWIGALLLLVAGIALSVLLARELRRPRGPAVVPAPERPAREASPARRSPPDVSTDALLAQDRAGLVAACVDLVDQVPSEALRHRMRDALRVAGVETVSAEDGAAFDGDRYRAVDRVPTKDPELHNRIAGTERPGYIDRGRTLREPEVLVYRLQEPRPRA
jgi:hypothetical protein